MVVLALVTNSRMGMIGPILFVGLAFLMVFLTGRIEINHKIFSKFFFIALIGFFAVGVMSDISTAILIERAYRNNRNTTEKLLETVNTFNDKEKLRQDRNDRVTRNKEISDGNWSEDYISNPFLGRFVQVKFDDNCLSRIYDFRPAAKNKLTEITIDKILVTLPSPIIKIVGLNVDKLYLNSFSMGDMIDVLSGRGFLGGFKTGSIIANSYCVFGWWYPFFFIILYSSIIKICQYLISRTSNLTRHKSISTLSFILPYYLFTSISLDNISSIVAVLLRGIWQLILIYFVALSLSNKIQKILFSRQHKMNL
jgi:ABC-type multidrug transport system fused ATPase/permease subunit